LCGLQLMGTVSGLRQKQLAIALPLVWLLRPLVGSDLCSWTRHVYVAWPDNGGALKLVQPAFKDDEADIAAAPNQTRGDEMSLKSILGSGLLLCMAAATGCGVTRSSVVNPSTGESMWVAQKDSLCAVELNSGYYYLIEQNTESCFLATSAPRFLAPVDCAKLRRRYIPAAKCINWLDGEGLAVTSYRPSPTLQSPM